MKLLPTFLFVLLSFLCIAQSPEPTSITLFRKGKEKQLTKFSDFKLLSKSDSSGITIEADAFVSPTVEVRQDSLTISVSVLAVEKQFDNSETQVVTTEFPMSQPGTLKIALKNIDKITVGRPAVKITTGLLCTLSVLSAIAVAPAMYVGTHYNYTRYRQMVGGSLLSAAAFLSLNLSFGAKTYKFNSENLNKNWQFQTVETK